MNKLFYCCVCFFLFSFTSLIAQSDNPKYSVPTDYKFETLEDYTKYEPQILETIDWYLWNSLMFNQEQIKQAKIFFMKWLTGTDAVSVVIDGGILPFITTSPELMVPFMMGWTKYSLNNGNSKNNIKCATAGIRTTIKFYDDNKFFFKDNDSIEKYRKMNDKKLAKYLAKYPSMSDNE